MVSLNVNYPQGFFGLYVKLKKTSGKTEDDHLQVGQGEEVLDFSFILVSFHPAVSFCVYKSHHGILDWTLASCTLEPLDSSYCD